MLFEELEYFILKYMLLDRIMRRDIAHWESKIDGFRSEAKDFRVSAWNDITHEVEGKRMYEQRYPSCAQQVQELYNIHAIGPISLILQEADSLETRKNEGIDFLNDARVKFSRAATCSKINEIPEATTTAPNSSSEVPMKNFGITEEAASFGITIISIAYEIFSTNFLQTWINDSEYRCESQPTIQDLIGNSFAGFLKVQQEKWLEINQTFVDALETSSHIIWAIKDDFYWSAGKRSRDVVQCNEMKRLKKWNSGGRKPNWPN